MNENICTTLARIRACGPCGIDPRAVPLTGYQKLKAYVHPTWGEDDPIPFATIVDSNGLDDALWCLRTIDFDRALRLFAVWCARRVQHLMTDQRSLDALDVVQRFVLGKATREELNAAEQAAWGAAKQAAWAAEQAAWAAEQAAWAAEQAAWAVAWGAAWVAVDAAARASGAGDTEHAAQRAMFLRVVACETEQEAVDLLVAQMPKSDDRSVDTTLRLMEKGALKP
jgi:hypothetical protein